MKKSLILLGSMIVLGSLFASCEKREERPHKHPHEKPDHPHDKPCPHRT